MEYKYERYGASENDIFDDDYMLFILNIYEEEVT